MLELNTFEIGLLEVLALTLWNSYFKKYSIVFMFIVLIVAKLSIQHWNVIQLTAQLNHLSKQRIWIQGHDPQLKTKTKKLVIKIIKYSHQRFGDET